MAVLLINNRSYNICGRYDLKIRVYLSTDDTDLTSGNCIAILDQERRKRRDKDKQMLNLALKLQRELRLAVTIDVSFCSYISIYLFSNFPPLLHEEYLHGRVILQH